MNGQSYYGSTPEAAKAKAPDLSHCTPIDRHTFLSFAAGPWKEFLLSVKKPRYKTLEQYEMLLSWVIPDIGSIPVEEIRTRDVQASLNRLSRKYSPTSVRHARKIISVVLNHAVREGLIDRNPATLAIVPKSEPAQRPRLSIHDAKKLLAAIRGTIYEGPIALCLLLGLRRGESLAVMWSDIEAGHLFVNRQVQSQGGKLVVTDTPKTARGRRKIPMPAIIQELLDRTPRVSVFAFPSASGEPIHPDNLRRGLVAALDRAGLPRMRIHDLRGSALSILIELGVDPATVAAIAGHSDTRVTMEAYVRAQQAAMERAGDWLTDAMRVD